MIRYRMVVENGAEAPGKLKLALLLLSLFLSGALAAQEYVPGRFIVQLDEPGKGSVGRAAAVQRAGVWAAVEERTGVVRDSVELVLNALIVEIDESRRGELETLPGVRRVYRDRKLRLDMDRAVDLVKARDAWRTVGGDDQAGKGIKIAILDTGIDVSHPAFKDESLAVPDGFPKFSRENDVKGTNRKVVAARGYGIQGAPDIRDRIGHGTAVASVAAGTRHAAPVGEFAGIAPKAFLGAYRLDDADGSFTSTALIRALEDVAKDGMDVMNMSLGFFPQARFEDDPVAQAVERLAERVIVTKSAGNMGPDAGMSTAPASPSAITVGASWNDRALGPSVEVPGLGGVLASRPDAELPTAPMTGELVDAAQAEPSGLLCALPAEGIFADRIVLILRGECTFELKLTNAKRARAKGAIIYTNANPVNSLWSIGAATLPVVMIGNEHGLRIKQALADEPGLGAKISFDLGSITLDANQLASFSSRGPGVSNNIHVDLVAPGDDIFLAAQRGNALGEIFSNTGYAVEGGTSFSAPMVAGAAAVLKAARPGLTVKQYKSLLVNSAAPLARSNGIVFGVQSAGAGRLDVERAVRAMTVASPVSVGFGVGRLTADLARDVALTNLGAVADTIAITVSPLGASTAAVIVSPATLTLRAGESRVVTVRLSGAELTPGEHQGFLLVKGAQSPVEMRVPYWYGASDKVAKSITLIAQTLWPRAGDRVQYLMRVSDAAGAALMEAPPVIEVAEGDGRVEAIQSLDGDFPGLWLVNLRLGVVSTTNVFRFTSGDAVRTVKLTL